MVVDPANVILIYTGEDGQEYEQPLSDVFDVGTLIDPDTGDDMPLARVEVR